MFQIKSACGETERQEFYKCSLVEGIALLTVYCYAELEVFVFALISHKSTPPNTGRGFSA